MNAAFASDGTVGSQALAFYQTAEFWIFIAFVMLVAAIGKVAFVKLAEALDVRSADIKEQIESAIRLRDEAQELWASYERKQHAAASEASEIIERARHEAARLADHAAKELEKSLMRREQLALESIHQAEAKAINEVRALAVNISINATRQLLIQKISARNAESIVDNAISELPEKLN